MSTVKLFRVSFGANCSGARTVAWSKVTTAAAVMVRERSRLRSTSIVTAPPPSRATTHAKHPGSDELPVTKRRRDGDVAMTEGNGAASVLPRAFETGARTVELPGRG